MVQVLIFILLYVADVVIFSYTLDDMKQLLNAIFGTFS